MNDFLVSIPDSFFHMLLWNSGPSSQNVQSGNRDFGVGNGQRAPEKDAELTSTLFDFLDQNQDEIEGQRKEEAVRRLTALDESGRTALIRAVDKGAEDEVRELVRESVWCGVSLNEFDRHGRTALMHAAMKDLDGIVSILVEGCMSLGDDVFIGGKDGCSAIFYAGKFSSKKSLKLLIEYGRSLQSSFTQIDKNGRTLLNCMSSGFDTTLYRQLIDAMRLNGGNFDFIDVKGKSALGWALHWRNSDFVNELLRAGAAIAESEMAAVLGLMGCQSAASALVEAAEGGHAGLLNALILRPDLDAASTMRAVSTMWPGVESTDRAGLMKLAARDGCRNVVVWLARQMGQDASTPAGAEKLQYALNASMLAAAAQGFSDLVAEAILLGAQSFAVDETDKRAIDYVAQHGSSRLFYALYPGA